MIAIRAALNLQYGAAKDFYICSLSSRCTPVLLHFQIISTFKDQMPSPLCCFAYILYYQIPRDVIGLFSGNAFQDYCLQGSAEGRPVGEVFSQ